MLCLIYSIMGEIRLDHCCRLCLKEGFSLTNIFSHHSEAGDRLNRIISFIYDIKILENDGLPSQICSPCMWRMIEFDACKKNVRSAEAEIVRLLSQTRPHMNEVSSHGSVMVSEDNEMDGAVEFGIEGSNFHSDATIKDEINVFEMENPIETDIKEPIPETVQHFQEADFHVLDSTEIKADEVTVEEFEDNCNQRVFCQPLRETPGSMDLMNMLSLKASEEAIRSSFEGESICTTRGISAEIRDTNEGIHEEDRKDNIVPEEESLSSETSKSILDVRKTGMSHSEASLSKSKFICDICKKSCTTKQILGRHVRVHYDERPFSCRKCHKTFKQDSVRHQHELRHLSNKFNFGKCEKGTKKRLYSCDLCARNFSSESGLWRHSNMHTKKYKCNSCGKYFGDNGNLKSHLRTHTKEKPFECKVCFKGFKRKGNLNTHLLIHSSERPYVCDICDKRFKSKGEKNKHALHHLRKK